MKPAVAGEQAVGHQGVQVGVEVQILAEGVDAHDDAGESVGQVERGAHVREKAFMGDVAELPEQPTVEAEIRTKHLRDGEGEMPVGHGEQDRFGQ